MGIFRGWGGWIGLTQLCLVPSIYAGQCNFKRVPPENKALVQVFQRAEKLSLGDPIPKSTNKPEALIFRAKARNWSDYKWDFRPLDLLVTLSAQRDYIEHCQASSTDLLTQLEQDYMKNVIPEIDAKMFLRSLMLATPCLEGDNLKTAQSILTKDFVENTDSFVDLLAATESEATRFTDDYKACSSPYEKSKHILVDSVLPSLERVIQGRGQKNMVLRLKRVRAPRMHFETARYLFQQLDNFLSD